MKMLVRTGDFVSSKMGKFTLTMIGPILDKILGFSSLNAHYNAILEKEPQNSEQFCRTTLEHFENTVEVDPKLAEALAVDEPLIVVANHPYGGVDSLALMELVAQKSKGDWKILANQLLSRIQVMRENVVPVFPHATGEEKAANFKAIKEMHRTLKKKGVLVMFPAARVSGRHPEHGFVCDLPWSSHPLTLAEKFGASVVCCHISGQNSEKFLSIPAENLTRRSITRVKEVTKQRANAIRLNHSFTMDPEFIKRISSFANKEEILRAHNYIGSDKSEVKPATKVEGDMSAYLSNSKTNYYDLLRARHEVIVEQKQFATFMFQGKEEEEVMQEIGRLRAKTFALIGAGTGKDVDLSPDDDYYHHIAVIEKSSGKIAGSYRVGFSNQILKEQGEDGLYLGSVFDIDSAFYKKIESGMELSRSFIPLEFQKSPQILDLLFRTLGTTATKTGTRTFYGSVTISNDYTPLSQAVLVDTLDRYYSAAPELRKLVGNQNPFRPTTTYHSLLSDAYSEHGLNRLNMAISEIEEGQRPIPPLMRYYIPLSAKFVSFKVEPTFANAIYCLLVIDTEEFPPRYRKRFLGRDD